MYEVVEKIRGMKESHKRSISIFLSSFFTIIFIFFWMIDRGFVGKSNESVENQSMAKVEKKEEIKSTVSKNMSPMEVIKRSVYSSAKSSKEIYLNIKESMASVFVPFITGIEIYERK